METHIKENLLIINLMESEFTFGTIKNSTKEIGKIIKCMVKESLLGLMEKLMKENSKMINNLDLVFSLGKIKDNIKDNGKTENIMVLELSTTHKEELKKKVNIKMETSLNGQNEKRANN